MKDLRATFMQWEAERPGVEMSTLYFKISVLRLAKIIEEEFDKLCREQHNVRANDMRVLFALRRAGKPYMLRPTDIFQSLLITAGAVTKQVDRLLAAGLVQRKPDPAHAGGTLVQLTARGVAVANDMTIRVAGEGSVHAALASLPHAQRQRTQDFLLKLVDRLGD
jgi:DNA-binding MarR family transcriptional regulator